MAQTRERMIARTYVHMSEELPKESDLIFKTIGSFTVWVERRGSTDPSNINTRPLDRFAQRSKQEAMIAAEAVHPLLDGSC